MQNTIDTPSQYLVSKCGNPEHRCCYCRHIAWEDLKTPLAATMLSLGSTTITPSQRSAVSNLITRYIQSSLACGWISTATFYCEILNALNPTSEEAVYLFALSLFQDARYRQALELLRCAPAGALHSSVKCRWLYARCCSKVPGREVEGRETLESLANFTSGR